MKLAKAPIKAVIGKHCNRSFRSIKIPVLILEDPISNLRCIHVSVTYVCYVNVINRTMTTSVTFNVKQSLLHRCYIGLGFIPSNRATLKFQHTTWPTTISVAQPSKKCWITRNWGEARSLPTTCVRCYCVEFCSDNFDAKCTGYYRLRIRLYIIAHLGNRFVCFCAVRWYNTGLQQSSNWRGSMGANLSLW